MLPDRNRFLIALLAVTLSASAARAQIEIDGLNHRLCHEAKDSKFHPDKFPKEAGRDPASLIAVEMLDRLAGDLFGGQQLTSLLRTNERDTGPGGVLGWWFHVNFTGTLATWTGP